MTLSSTDIHKHPSESTMRLNPNPPYDEFQWVIQIRRILDEVEDDNGIPVSISNVPKTLLSIKSESYIPQFVALGPYHHRRQELHEMERYKLSSAKRIQKKLKNFEFQNLVDQFTILEYRIRAHYHRYLDFHGETLAWMMAIDASFLLEFLEIYTVEEGKALRRTTSRMSHLVDYSRRKSAHNMILQDIMKLENQIPISLLSEILEFQCSSKRMTDEVLSTMLFGFLKEICPLKIEVFPSIDTSQHSHLLELLYYVITYKSKDQCEINETVDGNDAPVLDGPSNGNSDHIKQLLDAIRRFVSARSVALISRSIKFLLNISWRIIANLPVISIIKQLFSQVNQDSKSKDPSLSHGINTPPLMEEIAIPSVTELTDAGIRLSPTIGDLTTIEFNPKTATFYLPSINLDVNSETILRNLVAYETSIESGPLVFTRYTEMMNGIIDTDDDAKLLRERGVVLNHLKSDREVADLWNGMSKSVNLTRVPSLDKVIEEVNKFYNSKWRVKMRKFMKRDVFGSWQFLTFLTVILFLLLISLEAFCMVFTCARRFRVSNARSIQ